MSANKTLPLSAPLNLEISLLQRRPGFCEIPVHESAGFCPCKTSKIEKRKPSGAYETFCTAVFLFFLLLQKVSFQL